MDETVLREKISELLSEAQRPSAVAQPGAAARRSGDGDRPSSLGREMAALEDGLDHLRLAIKYLVFDLEATKRENRLLRQMLGDA
jgi:hypothetical protein